MPAATATTFHEIRAAGEPTISERPRKPMSDAGDSHDGTHAAAAGSSDLPVDDPPSQHRGVPEPSDDAVPSAEDHAYLALVPAPLPAPAHRTPWALVDHPAALARLVTRLRAARIIAIDAEFVQIYDRKPDDPPHRLALLQIAAAAEDPMSFVIDALRIPDLTPLQGPLGDANILKLFHGIGADARVLATRGLVARRTLDLEAVSRSVFGQRESGLQAMLQRARGIYLDKSLQRSDWTRRPLPTAMLAYAARDAEMTLALHEWLTLYYPWATALHDVPANEPPLDVAEWIRPLLEAGRPQRADLAVAEIQRAPDPMELVADLRAGLAAVKRPGQRARLLRAIADLDLRALAPDIRPLIAAPAAEERGAAARALGRLRDRESEPAVRALFTDPVYDVRQASRLALAYMNGERVARSIAPRSIAPRGRPGARGMWTSGGADTPAPEAAWQRALRARFPAPSPDVPSEAASPDSSEAAEKDR
jgi:hypothetical protein